MSIAVSAVVRPSVCLSCLLAGFAALQLAAAPLLLGLIGTRTYALAWPAAGCCVLAAAALLRAGWRLHAVNAWRLDISPAGQLRLAVYQAEPTVTESIVIEQTGRAGQAMAPPADAGDAAGVNAGVNADADADADNADNADNDDNDDNDNDNADNDNDDNDGGQIVVLAAGSTLWPGLLCLCWRGADGRTGALIAWPGNVAAGRFRALALACRAIAGQHGAGA